MKQLKSNKGFTLVELIIVIAILAIIMLIAIPNFSGIQQRMQVRADKSSAAQIGKAIRIWYTEYTSDDAFANAVGTTNPTAVFEATAGAATFGQLKAVGTGGSTAGDLPKQGDTTGAVVAPINLINKLNEYVDTALVPKSLRTATNNIVEPYQYYSACIVGSGTAEKVVVCISNYELPEIPTSGVITVGYTGDHVNTGATPAPSELELFNATVAYLEP